MATGILQSLGGGITPEEWERILAGQYPQGVMDFEGYDKMINQHYDSWSPTDGIPSEFGSQITESEAMRALKESMGSAFTESEGRKILGLPPVPKVNLNSAQQEYLRDLKGQLGSQFTEREGMRMLGEGNPHIGEPVSNLGLPDVASAYSPGTESNPNWGNKKYDYKKNIYDVQTIDLMINSGAINPKRDRLTHRPDVAEDAYQVHLASADNTLWNDQLQMFMSPDWMRTGSMGQERFKENIMGGDRRYRSLRSNTQRGAANQPLKFT
jgi:hypothetical protein